MVEIGNLGQCCRTNRFLMALEIVFFGRQDVVPMLVDGGPHV